MEQLKMKKYILFVWYLYYPSGGVNDFEGSFDTILECLNWVKENRKSDLDWTYFQVIDNEFNIIINDTIGLDVDKKIKEYGDIK